MQDLHYNIQVKRAISPVVGTDNTALVSQVIDRQGYNSLEFLIATGALTDTDATFAVLVEHSDTNFSGAAVPDSQLIGLESEAAFTADADDNAVRKIGYRGSKRYVRLTITPTGNNSGNIPVAAIAVLGHPAVDPVIQAQA